MENVIFINFDRNFMPQPKERAQRKRKGMKDQRAQCTRMRNVKFP